MKIKSKIAAVSLLSMVLIGAVALPAFASEGVINTSLTQVQPGFSSRQWYDANSTTNATTVYLGGCTDNAGGGAPGSKALTSVKLSLQSPTQGIVKSITQKCGTYNFGRVAADYYIFVVTAINGNSSANRADFLNASTVTITY